MGKLRFDISVSLDGFVAGPNATREEPLGKGGEQLHDWATRLASWRESHGYEGGETGRDSEVMEELSAGVGAIVMGRRMFSGEDGPWGDEPFEGWWGDEPPFHMPVYVLTSHPREPLVKGDTTFTFVTDGAASALEQARAAAGGADVAIGGGANVIQQYLSAGEVDEFQLHVVPLLLGGGVRLFDDLGGELPRIELLRTVESPRVTHLRYRVVK